MNIKITVGDLVLKAEMHPDKAPETCRMLTEKMPIKGNLIQARWSGEAAWLQMDPHGVEAPQENATSYPGPGQLLYYPGGVSEKEMLFPHGSAIFASARAAAWAIQDCADERALPTFIQMLEDDNDSIRARND